MTVWTRVARPAEMTAEAVPALVHRARETARMVLVGLPQRWRHTVGVSRRAEELVAALDPGDDPDVLIAAAWLHDIGYGRAAVVTGFHPLDGAVYLRRLAWPGRRIAGLVAHHSGAAFVARDLGLAGALGAFPQEQTAL